MHILSFLHVHIDLLNFSTIVSTVFYLVSNEEKFSLSFIWILFSCRYNQASLGVRAVIKLNTSRGNREGNAAFLKVCALPFIFFSIIH